MFRYIFKRYKLNIINRMYNYNSILERIISNDDFDFYIYLCRRENSSFPDQNHKYKIATFHDYPEFMDIIIKLNIPIIADESHFLNIDPICYICYDKNVNIYTSCKHYYCSKCYINIYVRQSNRQSMKCVFCTVVISLIYINTKHNYLSHQNTL